MRWFVESNRDSDRDMASSKGIESIAHQAPRNGENILFFRRGTSRRFGRYTREWPRGSTITVAFLSGKPSGDTCAQAQDFLNHSISNADLAQWWDGVDAGSLIMIFDTCYAGAVSGRDFRPAPLGENGFGQLAFDKGLVILRTSF